jgi:hypothetical protein
MRSSTDLDACFRGGGAGSFTENKKWTTGSKLFGAGLAAGEHMPILFAAAERDSGLIYWAVLSDVVVDDGDPGQGIGPSTTYSFAQLAPISPSKNSSQNDGCSLLKQTRQQARARNASCISWRRS